MKNSSYPPVSFYFKLSIKGATEDISFSEASGITLEKDIIETGGEDRFKYKIPTTAKFQNLVLKRGLAPSGSPILKWVMETIDSDLSETIKTKDLEVCLNNAVGKTVLKWEFVNAWPVKWSCSDLISQEGEIAIESLEFAYSSFNQVN